MSTLRAGLGAGLEIETNTESRILQDWIEIGWPTSSPAEYPGLPAKADVDFGAYQERIVKPVTLRTYTVFSNIIEIDIGHNMIKYNVPVAVDVYVRDIKASAERREPTKLVAIETYIRDYISTNRLGLRSKGIHNIELDDITRVEEPPDDEEDVVWYHTVFQVRMHWHMNRL